MAKFVATLLNIMPESNPEECWLPVEAASVAAAKTKAAAVLDGELRGLGWRSYRDTALWGKVQRVLVDVVTAEDHRARCGEGNTRGSEGQNDHEARLRKAAKV
jgi:hypothetical protein